MIESQEAKGQPSERPQQQERAAVVGGAAAAAASWKRAYLVNGGVGITVVVEEE
jgi:hypothetical protein